MSKLGRSVYPIVLITIVTSAQPLARAQVQEGNYFVLAQALVRTAFPELQKQEYEIQFAVAGRLGDEWNRMNPVGISIWPSGQRRVVGEPSVATAYSQFLEGTVLVVLNPGSIDSALFHGQYVHSQQLMTITETAKGHPNWTDPDVQAALAMFGAKYGPDRTNDFLRDLNVERFTPILGKIRSSRSEFAWHTGSTPDPRGIFTPAWLTYVETGDAGTQPRCYSLAFEPIDGRLTSLGATSCN